MSIENAIKALAKVKFAETFAYPIRQNIYRADMSSTTIYVHEGGDLVFLSTTTAVSERDEGYRLALRQDDILDPDRLDDESYILEAALEGARRLVLHELYEAYSVDGKRTKDPHNDPNNVPRMI